MKLGSVEFTQSQIMSLPEATRSLFLKLAHIRNDIRSLNSLIIIVTNKKDLPPGIESEVAYHQNLHLLRLICGSLNEAWKVIEAAAAGGSLIHYFQTAASDAAKNAKRKLGKYFGNGGNHIQRIRNSHAYHYGEDFPDAGIASLPTSTTHSFVTGQTQLNIFYQFSERIFEKQMFGVELSDSNDVRAQKAAVFRQEFTDVMDWIFEIADDFMIQVVKSLNLRFGQPIEVGDLADIRDIEIRYLFNEPAIPLASPPPSETPADPRSPGRNTP